MRVNSVCWLTAEVMALFARINSPKKKVNGLGIEYCIIDAIKPSTARGTEMKKKMFQIYNQITVEQTIKAALQKQYCFPACKSELQTRKKMM